MNKQYIILLVLLIACTIAAATDVGGGGETQKPNAAERAIGFIDPVTHWDKLKSWVKVAWINHGPYSKSEEPLAEAGEAVKKAFSESYETSKETAEHASNVAGQAWHNTADTVKRTVSGSNSENEHQQDPEL
ncbi:hypothetical protein ACHQM5_007625 [Ranunculus cassubicifolius]